jgi:16S rRNA (cytosine1402-N4)-methyltransferase
LIHKPVLLHEVVELLHIRPDGTYLDATIGGGGHAYEIARRVKDGLLIGIDCDGQALEFARERLRPFEKEVQLIQANFADLQAILDELDIELVDGVLFDLGDSPERGFSFGLDGPLDMRMDREHNPLTAKDIVNTYSRDALIRILREYGEERWAPRIARAIVEARQREPLEGTRRLSDLVAGAIPAAARRKMKIHPATRAFQALRIAVNDELDNLRRGLESAFERLSPGGMLIAISFHSLEDRIVKRFLQVKAGKGKYLDERLKEAELFKLVRPTEEEIAENPRARSAKLRAARKVV